VGCKCTKKSFPTNFLAYFFIALDYLIVNFSFAVNSRKNQEKSSFNRQK
jgi:hypothetical protein